MKKTINATLEEKGRLMEFEMPLSPDMKEQTTRNIAAKFPNDITQEEFWQFVTLAGHTFFGQTVDEDGDKKTTAWDLKQSFENFGTQCQANAGWKDEDEDDE
jgi:hypothetical protein